MYEIVTLTIVVLGLGGWAPLVLILQASKDQKGASK